MISESVFTGARVYIYSGATSEKLERFKKIIFENKLACDLQNYDADFAPQKTDIDSALMIADFIRKKFL